jgi:hypothetical protein
MVEFHNFVSTEKIPSDGIVLIRVSDDVLDNEDWTVDYLLMRNGSVKEQVRVNFGVYNIPDMKGWTCGELSNWSRFENTGSHPQEFHDIG